LIVVVAFGALAGSQTRLIRSRWTMTFAYITAIPKRIYFDVVFRPDGRAIRVSPTYGGRLD
jgi:hypothetical protein